MNSVELLLDQSNDLTALSTEEGFEIFDAVFAPSECFELLRDLPKTCTKVKRAGMRHLLRENSVLRVATDERMLRIAKKHVGETAVPFRATLFEKSGFANWLVVWHQDTALPLSERFDSTEWGPWSIKNGINYAHAPEEALSRVIALRVHLDPSTELNGPLRVIPGTHSLGVLDDAKIFATAHKRPVATCLTSIGGVIAMRPLLIHASSKAKTDDPRRVLHIEYADSLDICAEARLVFA